MTEVAIGNISQECIKGFPEIPEYTFFLAIMESSGNPNVRLFYKAYTSLHEFCTGEHKSWGTPVNIKFREYRPLDKVSITWR